ncbi:hypothetical protein HCX49_03600 [Sphingobacterium kitahiroshimense]|uniref:SIR2 family protein n=1 Tax=Sphingobacterium sp. B16(2022) TaxID=2914044 RepID=UPI00143C5D85|nr:SIR2 family protein [Sphingobacterium sp. B16(2022)]NJI72281.1 hypothetical protein [Sphingobacterium sp. B16(2022)]
MEDNEEGQSREEVKPSSNAKKPKQVMSTEITEQIEKESVCDTIAEGDEQKANGAESKNERSDSSVVTEKENNATNSSCEEAVGAKELASAIKPDLSYLFVNGPDKFLTATNVKMVDGDLTGFDQLAPFAKKDDSGNEVKPTIEDAQKAKQKLYKEFFRKSFKNVLILSGAGSSIDVGLPLMKDLWIKVKEKITDRIFTELCKKINHSTVNDFEALISRLEGVIQYTEDYEVRGRKLSDYREDILKVIRKETKLDEPKGEFPHVKLLEKLLQRKQTSSRVKVFTLNYDLLFEKAANHMNAVIIDGFSFTSPRTFSGRFFDYDIVQREGSKVNEEDNFITRVFHLYKLHGSLNWHRNEKSGSIIIDDNTQNPLMVYPREGKYKDSYGQPFFEMIARFQRNLRESNDTLLICIGYSFNDNHINAAIEEAINQNPGFRMAVVDPYLVYAHKGGSAAYRSIIKNAIKSDRIMVVSERFRDFANHFPEIQTYDNELRLKPINLRNEGQ